jgi:hypothetical protein
MTAIRVSMQRAAAGAILLLSLTGVVRAEPRLDCSGI